MAIGRKKSAAPAATPQARRYCAQPEQFTRQFDPSVSAGRAFAIINGGKKWVNGTQLTYYLYRKGDGSPAAWQVKASDAAEVVVAFEAWKKLGIGIDFKQVDQPDDARIRIGFDQNDGSWSYVGRDTLGIRDSAERTMNFGWPLNTAYGRDTALHEIGHAIGLEHEHQNPFAGIVWNTDAVKAYFRGSPNFWSDQQIDWNILRKIAQSEVKGSNWDPDSVMEYEFGPGLIQAPPAYQNGLQPKGGLSKADKEWIVATYPGSKPKTTIPELQIGLSQKLGLKAGQTRVYAFKPKKTRTYHVGTFGTADTVLVVFEKTAGGNVEIGGNDDSGTDINARVDLRLRAGREYQVGIRLYYAEVAADTAIMVW